MANPQRGGPMTHTPAGEPLTPNSPHKRLSELHDEVHQLTLDLMHQGKYLSADACIEAEMRLVKALRNLQSEKGL